MTKVRVPFAKSRSKKDVSLPIEFPIALFNYTLRTNERGEGTWIITLQNQRHRPVGTIYIGANKGTVTRTEGMFAGAPMDAVVEDRREGEVADEERSGDNRIMR